MKLRRRGLALLGAAAVALALAESCADNRGSLGADCLKDEDCITGVCAQLVCVAAPQYLDGEAPVGSDAAASAEGSPALDATFPDGPTSASIDASAEGSTLADAFQDAPSVIVDASGAGADVGPDSSSAGEAGTNGGVDGAQSDGADAGESGGADASGQPPADAATGPFTDALPDTHLDGSDD